MGAVAPLQGDLASFFHDYTKARLGEPPPVGVTRYVRRQCDQLITGGNSPRVIRKAIELLVTRREHPRLLPFRVLDAAQGRAACTWQRHPNKMRLSSQQLKECGCTDCIETIPYSEIG
jgi:hypothetical protein